MAIKLGEKYLADVELELMRGAGLAATATFERDGTPVDLTGASALCQVRRVNDGEVIADISAAYSFGADGSIDITVTPEMTAGMAPGKWVWDVMMTESGGWVTSLMGGKCTVHDPVSEGA